MSLALAPLKSAHLVSPRPAPFSGCRYLVLAASDPGLLPRLLEPFAKRGLAPSRFHSAVEHDDDGETWLSAEIAVEGLDDDAAEHVERVLAATVGVYSASLRRG